MPTFDAGQTGLTGTVGLILLDLDGTIHVARSTAGITEAVSGSGIYHIDAHDDEDDLIYVWDVGSGTIGASETIYALPPTVTESADALLNRDMSAVTDSTARSPLNALRLLRNKTTAAAGGLTVTKEDDSTTAWSAVLTTDSGADPVTVVDPT